MGQAQGDLIASFDGELNEEMLAMLDQAHEQNVDAAAEIRIARLALLQQLSPEVADNKAGYKSGLYINNFTREIYSREVKAPWLIEAGVPPEEVSKQPCMGFIPVMKLPTEYIKWINRKDRKEGDPPFEFKTLDKGDPRVRAGTWAKRGGTWGKNGEKGAPPVTDNINYLVLPFDVETKQMLGNFIILTFSRTSSGAGVSLTTQLDTLKAVRRLRAPQTVFYLASKAEQYTDGKCYIAQVHAAKQTAMEMVPELCKLATGMALMLSKPGEGPARQAQILGDASLTEDDSHAAGMDEGGPVVDAKSGGGNGEGDPFPEPEF